MVAAVSIPQPTEFAELDRQLAKLKDKAPEFARLTARQRRALLHEMKEGVVAVADEWVRKACDYKGIDYNGPLSGEEWLAGPFITVRNFRLLEDALAQIETRGQPEIPQSWIREREGGGLAVQVFPTSTMDKMLFAGITAEVYVQKHITTPAQLRERQAIFYKKPDHQGKVSLVLGAGNVSSIPPTDVASKLFIEGKVCILKMNPVNAYVGPLLERAFRGLIEKGYLAICYGGVEVGKYLVEHAAVDEIHITGSDKTHDAMVWGPPGPERAERMARNEPLLKKEITSQLGNVSPVLVVPGPYSAKELEFQAQNIAGAVTNNASFNCNAAKLLVQPKGWGQREGLLGGIQKTLAGAPVRKAYYPGAQDRYAKFTSGRKTIQIGQAGEGQLPWTIIPDVDPSKHDDVIFREEPFCAILSETAVGSDDPITYLRDAVEFVNKRVWGTLNATVIVHPALLDDDKVAAALEDAIEQLRYGAIGVNLWPASIFALGSAPWGGAPGAPLTDIQSGRGWVHNSFMIEDIDKCVARAPLTMFPKPLWFPGHKTANEVGRRLVQLEKDASWFKLPGVALNALRG